MQPKLIFTYGTLRVNAMKHKDNLRAGLEFVREDKITAKLYDVSWFPGILDLRGTFDGNLSSVVGDVFLVKNQETLDALDFYEGAPTLYRRERTQTESGLDVEVYVFQDPRDVNARIESGDWLAWAQERNSIPASPTGGVECH